MEKTVAGNGMIFYTGNKKEKRVVDKSIQKAEVIRKAKQEYKDKKFKEYCDRTLVRQEAYLAATTARAKV